VTRRPLRRRLVLRVYLFTAGLFIAVFVAMATIPRMVTGPTWHEPQAALLQGVVEHLSHLPAGDRRHLVARLRERVPGQLTVYDARGVVLASTHAPPAGGLNAREQRVLARSRSAIDWDRIAMRSDDGSLFGLYLPPPPRIPWRFIAPFFTAILGMILLASVWFARRMARPLAVLGDAARRFGAADTGARAGLARDDEFGDLGRSFDEMAARIEDLLRSQRQLMADISHELRTPLARIRVALELAVEDPEAARDVLADVGADLDEIDELMERTLIMARLDVGDPGLPQQEIDLAEVTASAAGRFERLHGDRELRIRGAGLGTLRGDPSLLRRALDNLLDNAVKYSDAGAPVELDVQAAAQRFELRVIDSGRGMTPEELQHAFTPFWRADASRTRTTGGVGLGLALARRIARAHQGDVELTSRPGQGTTALLWLPRPGG
jgi:signal transduction histidine kinase